ncbi:MAG TPA: 30S ribosomal protein S7 [Candidatus Methanofastidiosa archaeon]|nr:30S ribosomal protein S7 [Candidatus Methanofastidiosa archaeon]HPR41984.1 30S ribosomal protein S7 [Candidatus Methanofastidiosa archaeon]
MSEPYEFKLFGKWDTDVEVQDEGLKRYINLTPVLIPHSGGRHEAHRFWKIRQSIVERLVNKTMRSGAVKKKVSGKFIRRAGGLTGKKNKAYKTVKEAFDVINKKTKNNPIEVLVIAIQNSSPREETTTIAYGGVKYHQAVDIAPQRRIDVALKNISLGANARAFKSKRSYSEALADEIIAAYEKDIKSFAVGKKEEIERIAKSAR